MDTGDEKIRITVTETGWLGPLRPASIALAPSSIHVWEFPLVTPNVPLESYRELLSEDERERAARFRFERDMRRFSVARARVRAILGGYTNRAGRDLRFTYAKHGKPALADNPGGIGFSVSHSGELAMVAVTLDRETGVDLELIRDDVETDKLAERFFSAQERRALRALSDATRIRAFFRCWTCKEAFLKAQGLGLQRSLESFDVEVDPERPARLLATRPNAEEARLWRLHDVPTHREYAAAAAWEGRIAEIKIVRES